MKKELSVDELNGFYRFQTDEKDYKNKVIILKTLGILSVLCIVTVGVIVLFWENMIPFPFSFIIILLALPSLFGNALALEYLIALKKNYIVICKHMSLAEETNINPRGNKQRDYNQE